MRPPRARTFATDGRDARACHRSPAGAAKHAGLSRPGHGNATWPVAAPPDQARGRVSEAGATAPGDDVTGEPGRHPPLRSGRLSVASVESRAHAIRARCLRNPLAPGGASVRVAPGLDAAVERSRARVTGGTDAGPLEPARSRNGRGSTATATGRPTQWIAWAAQLFSGVPVGGDGTRSPPAWSSAVRLLLTSSSGLLGLTPCWCHRTGTNGQANSGSACGRPEHGLALMAPSLGPLTLRLRPVRSAVPGAHRVRAEARR